MDLTATETAELSSVSLRSITNIFDKFRTKIARCCKQSNPFEGTIEVDESRSAPGAFPANVAVVTDT